MQKYVWSKCICIILLVKSNLGLKYVLFKWPYMLVCPWKVAWMNSYQGVNINYLQGCLETTNCSFALFFLFQLVHFHWKKMEMEKKRLIYLGDSMCLRRYIWRILKLTMNQRNYFFPSVCDILHIPLDLSSWVSFLLSPENAHSQMSYKDKCLYNYNIRGHGPLKSEVNLPQF